jgi:hypothetical protein
MFAPRALARRSNLLPDIHLAHRWPLGGVGEAGVDPGDSAHAGAQQAQTRNRNRDHGSTPHRLKIRERHRSQGRRPNQRSDMAPPAKSSSPAPAANAAVTSRCSSRVAT